MINSFINGCTALCWALASFSVSYLFFTQTVGILGREISPFQGRYLHAGQHKINAYKDIHVLSGIRTHDTSVRASETVHALDRVVTVIGEMMNTVRIFYTRSKSWTLDELCSVFRWMILCGKILDNQHMLDWKLSKTLLRVRHNQIVTLILTSYLEINQFYFEHTRTIGTNIFKHTRLSFLKFAYSRNDAPSNMF
jgi:hypothetical protein